MENSNRKDEIGFKEFGISTTICEALEILGYHTPTPIQKAGIPIALQGKNLVGKSQTGSGKTAAFAVPICEKIKWEERFPQALVLEPTRELAVQVQDEIFQIGRTKRLKVPVVFGGMPVEKQALSLKQRTHIVVGTPGRIIDHMKRGNLITDKIKMLVIDEADLMLDMGFLEDVEYIVRNCGGETELQILLFSATLEENIQKLINDYMKNPEYISVESDYETAEGITHTAYSVEPEDKYDVFMQIMSSENPEGAMIFCDTREMVNTLFQKMRRAKIRCGMLHGGMEQRDRLYAISDFRKGIFRYLITTDVASRGIDFQDITHVINYDFPTNKANYVHRTGRTARNGKTGKAISLVTADEMHYFRAVPEYIGISIDIKKWEKDEKHNEKQQAFRAKQREKVILKKQKGEVYNETIMELSIGGGKKSKIRAGDIVGAICSIPDVITDDIGVIDVRDSITYVEILNKKGAKVLDELQRKTIKGKLRKVRKKE